MTDTAREAHSLPPGGEPPSPTRRQLFTAGATLAVAALSAPRRASAQVVVRPNTGRPKPPPSAGDSLLRLVRRITNGVTLEELGRAKSRGFRRYLNYHLNADAIDDSAVETFVAANYPDLAKDGPGLYQLNQGSLLNQLSEATVYRAAFSKRQLYERMVHFWSDHFNIYYPKVRYLKLVDDREVIRKHALGKFPDLLRASAHSAAMLEYLDNTRSRRGRVNENYARELMELHTMGVDGGYTQTDVAEVTRCLTGWTIAGRGAFNFDPTGHDFTEKTVLGTTIPASTQGAAGVNDGEKVLEILLAHPSTATFISAKMIRWLLQYDPPEALVTRVASTFTRTGGDIPSMIRTILTPDNLLAAPAKYRQPVQLVVSALRATQPGVTSMRAVGNRYLRTLGQGPFLWEDPDGYPDNVDWWAGTVIQRWNFATYLANLASGALVVSVAPLMQVSTPTGVTDAIDERAFGSAMSTTLRARLEGYLAAAPITTSRVREALALALGSSDFQWY